MSERLGTYKGDPIVQVDRVDGVNAVIDDCPGCGETHRHGADVGIGLESLAHRGAHCHGDGYGSYWLVYTTETEGYEKVMNR